MVSKNTKPFNLILLGDPAAGKATQAAWLVKKYKLYDLDMGLELRKRRRSDARLNSRLEANYDKGKLTPHRNLLCDIFRTIVNSVPKTQGILFMVLQKC